MSEGRPAAVPTQPQQPPPFPPGRRSSPPRRQAGAASEHDATRYLCVAAQTDALFNNRLISSTLGNKRSAIAASPGVDLVTVLKYGLAARQRQALRDAALTILLFITVLSLIGGAMPIVVTALVLAWLVMYAESLYTYYSVLAPQLRRNVFDAANAPEPTDQQVARRLRDVGNRSRGNLTVFPAYQPFIGYGRVFQTWSFTLNVAAPEEGKRVKPFEVGELYDHMAAATGEIGLPGAAVEDRIFVSGNDLLHHVEPESVRRAVLPREDGPPAAHVSDEVIRQLREDPHTRARPYLSVSVPGWGGELVTTLFLRFTLLPRRDLLFIEASYSLLAPVRESYRAVDRLLSKPTARQIAGLAPNPFTVLGGLLVGWIRLLTMGVSPLGNAKKDRMERRAILEDRAFNYGATLSVREAGSDHKYYRYFQQLDADMYGGLVERRVLDALVDFMTEHNIDVSDLKERQTTILNNGVYVTGEGSVNAGSIAAGTNAFSASFDRLRQSSPQGTSRGTG